MARYSKTSKFLVLAGTLSLLFASVSAAGLDVQDGYVWLNDLDNREEIRIDEPNSSDMTVELENENVNFQSPIINSTQFRDRYDNGDISDLGDYTVVLRDGDGDEIDRKEIKIRELRFDITRNGTGFVNEKLGAGETNPLELSVGIRGASPRETVEKESIDIGNFNIDNRKASIVSESDVDTKQDQQDVDVTIYPEISEKPVEGERFRLVFSYSFDGSSLSVENFFYPKINTWKAQPVESPPHNLDYSDIESFSYTVDIYENGNDVSPDLYEENFDLDIRELGGSNFEPDNQDGSWLSVTRIDGGDADYLLELDRIPQLETGTYEFETYLENEGERTKIDTVRVSNLLKLSGRVMDSQNRGVKTSMTLNRDNRVIPIETGGNGQYYKEIEVPGGDNLYDSVGMSFFDLGQSTSDADVNVNDVNFEAGENENLAGGQESIKFQYWQDPEVEEDAIDPINMMAVKFAYPIAEDGHSAKMKFNPSGIDVNDLNVYECSNWNFLGTECLGDWNKISNNDVSITYGNFKANFPIDNPYQASDSSNETKNILMNAYLVGTSADLIMNGRPSVSGTNNGRIETGGEVDISGVISSENDNAVEGAEVDLSFYKGSEEVHSFDKTETDASGRFSIKGNAPSEPGNYSLKVEASADNYDSLERKFDNRFETFIAEGIDLKSDALGRDETFEVTLGENVSTTLTVKNTGQTEMQDVDLTFSGMGTDFYSVSDSRFSSIQSGESRDVEVTFSLPESYGIDNYPALDIQVSAENDEGKEFKDDDSIQTQLTYSSSTQNSENETADRQSEDPDGADESSSSFSPSEAVEMTGDFIESQSSLNIALGMILVFLMVIAGAVSKKKDQADDRRGRPQVQNPINSSGDGSGNVKDLTGNDGGNNESQNNEDRQEDQEVDSEDDEVDSQIDEIAGAFEEGEDGNVQEEQPDEEDEETIAEELKEEEDSHFACEVCGEKFDSESGRSLHEDVMH